MVAAAGAVASQARIRDPELRETPHIRAGLAGVKRKGLASELLAHRSDSYHLSWTSLWVVAKLSLGPWLVFCLLSS